MLRKGSEEQSSGFTTAEEHLGALPRLLTDIEAGLVDQTEVDRIDGLTRSLSDFAKIVDRLDVAGARFVSAKHR